MVLCRTKPVEPSHDNDFPTWSPELLISVETILPEQALELRHGRRGHPERMLLVAVLSQALYDFFHFPDGSRIYQQSRTWIFSENRGSVTFVELCELLGLDVSVIRNGVIRRRKLEQHGEAQPLAPTGARRKYAA